MPKRGCFHDGTDERCRVALEQEGNHEHDSDSETGKPASPGKQNRLSTEQPPGYLGHCGGTFINGPKPASPRQNQNGFWRIELSLPREYEYRFVVDGKWIL